MTRPIAPARRGVTLIELLVVMAVLTGLAALALMIAPGIANSDNTLKGTADVQTTLKIAQGMAGAARLPRGVRLIAPPATAANPNVVTELQFLEVPPVLVPDPLVLVATASNPNGVGGPRVEFSYEMTAGAVTTRHCFIYGLNADQSPQVVNGATLVLPTLGIWARITSGLDANSEVTLDVYPDAYLGAASQPGSPPAALYRTFHFGIYGAARPLLGEPTVQLPKNIGIDMTVSSPPVTTPGTDFDIVFAPSGQMVAAVNGANGNGQVFLWVRDYTKVPSMNLTGTALADGFRKGGEQQIVGIRSAAVGTAPVVWPNMATGGYSGAQNQFSFAREKLTGP